MTLIIGQTAAFSAPVEHTRTAASLSVTPETPLPAVFGTPFMIADMERACADLLAPCLGAGDVSVGVKIEVTHLAPTPVGVTVTSTATFTGQEGPLYWFDVSTEDPAGKVGEGRIARAIVNDAKLIGRSDARK